MVNRNVLIIGGCVILLLCLCIGGGIALVTTGVGTALIATQPAADTGEKFMKALVDQDFQGAYNLCTTDLKGELGNPQGLQKLITNGRVQPTSYSFSSRNVSNGQATLQGTINLSGGRSGTVSLVLHDENGWKVAGFNLKES